MPDIKIAGSIVPFESVAVALLELITELVRGQPPEVKKQLWEWYVEDVRRWRKMWGLEDK